MDRGISSSSKREKDWTPYIPVGMGARLTDLWNQNVAIGRGRGIASSSKLEADIASSSKLEADFVDSRGNGSTPHQPVAPKRRDRPRTEIALKSGATKRGLPSAAYQSSNDRLTAYYHRNREYVHRAVSLCRSME